ncbi:DUF1002 domain-containing protein [Bacillus taeanensis]|uniref:DUF1002 domain-containing protein n=1 Tax=Bacillus taeanensis TaxID=273032 RepID=A0A366Y0H3_9BACI|nr:DUF1002 domain-containing protein [Bacillus taeanensis]RBW70539.1 DUF1002 domain-containing protein [Bacillus taeanensis]
MKNWLMIFSLLASLLIGVSPVLADAAPGDVIVTLGEDLSEEQKNKLLEEMGVSQEIEPIIVTNKEEHQYLGQYISKAQIGTRALSSSKITIGEKDSGLTVTTNNITWVSEEMYVNSLVTAGVKDAEVYITAPFEVSGTAALTGLIKAYEITANIEIPEEQKQVANEEMVQSAQLGEKFGVEKATELMTRIKEEIAQNPPKTEQELRTLIEKVAADLGITLTEEELQSLISLFNKMKELNIDWNQVQDQLEQARNNLDEFLNREETKSFIQSFIDFLLTIVDGIKNMLSK